MDQTELIDKITSEVLSRLKIQPTSQTTPVVSASGTTVTREITSSSSSSGGESSSGVANTARMSSTVALTPASIAKYIDHTLLKPDATEEQIDKLCDEAVEYGFYSVCVNSCWVEHCARRLRGTGVKVACVVGFPLGAMDSRSKSFETRNAIENGADEIDMVMNIGALKSGNLRWVEEDIRWVLRACRPTTVLKVILENALLTDSEKVIACQIAKKAGAQFVKTSTGFAKSGATVEDVALMRRTVGPKMGVKAAGGIRDFETARAMIVAGATRIGASSSVAIVTGKAATGSY